MACNLALITSLICCIPVWPLLGSTHPTNCHVFFLKKMSYGPGATGFLETHKAIWEHGSLNSRFHRSPSLQRWQLIATHCGSVTVNTDLTCTIQLNSSDKILYAHVHLPAAGSGCRSWMPNLRQPSRLASWKAVKQTDLKLTGKNRPPVHRQLVSALQSQLGTRWYTLCSQCSSPASFIPHTLNLYIREEMFFKCISHRPHIREWYLPLHTWLQRKTQEPQIDRQNI